MILIGMHRQASIKSRLQDLRYKEMKLSQKIQELATYAANIADGIITPEEMATSSAGIFGAQMAYMMRSIPMAMMQGKQAFQMYWGQYGAQMMAMRHDPSMSMMMQTNPMMLQMQFFQQALERQGKIEQKKLHAEEKKLQQEKLTLENQIKMLEAELRAVEKATDKEIAHSAPKFGLQG